MPITQLYTKICVYCYSSDLLLMSNFELWMLNIKITLQKKWTKYFHISKFEKSQMVKMNYTWKKKIMIQHVLYMYVSMPSNHDANYFTTNNSLLLNEKYIWNNKKNVYHYTALFIFSNFSKLHLYKMMLISTWKTEGPWVYSRYIGSSARAEWQTFLPS